MDTGAYANSSRSYIMSIGKEGADFGVLANRVSTWLNSSPGYQRLEDSYLPNYFCLARYVGPTNITNILQQAGRATITFDRYPQRFLKTGDVAVTVPNDTSITNPTTFPAKPLIRINGNGDGRIEIGDYTIDITGLSGFMYIDCENEQCYKDAINTNNNVTLAYGFPILKKGNTYLKYRGGITSVVITPRWWTL